MRLHDLHFFPYPPLYVLIFLLLLGLLLVAGRRPGVALADPPGRRGPAGGRGR